jgi:hypothetical protein
VGETPPHLRAAVEAAGPDVGGAEKSYLHH